VELAPLPSLCGQDDGSGSGKLRLYAAREKSDAVERRQKVHRNEVDGARIQRVRHKATKRLSVNAPVIPRAAAPIVVLHSLAPGRARRRGRGWQCEAIHLVRCRRRREAA
jgi:hypothetical protein